MRGKFIRRKINNAKKWISERPYYVRRTWNRLIIKNKDFTIISNNCWAGKAYQYLGMPYLSPTVGLYFFAEDYLKFVSNLHYYFSLDLKFINAEQSRFVEVLRERKHTSVPIGILDDIEIVFLHYNSEQEAYEKWNRRKERVNYENLYIKFSKMNLCTEEHMKKFDELEFSNKFMLNNCKSQRFICEIYWNGKGNANEILSDTMPFPGNIRLVSLFNKQKAEYQEKGMF